MRKYYLDYLRVMAIVAVIVIHTSAGFYIVEQQFASLDWWFANIMTTAARYSVPLFVAISGALLLTPGINISDFYRNRALRLIPPTIIWMIVFTYFKAWSEFDVEAPHRFFTLEIFTKLSSYTHLWYLPMYLCLIAIAPFFAKWVNGDTWTQTEIRILFFVTSAFFILKWISSMGLALYGHEMNWLGTFVYFLPYFLAGYYLNKYADQLKYARSTLIFVFIFCVILGCAGNYYLASHFHIFQDWLLMDGPLSFVLTLVIFLWAKQTPLFQRESKIIKTLSDSTFGIYLIHPIFMYLIMMYSPAFMHPAIIYIPLASLLIFAASFACVYCIRKLPGSRFLC